jgi:hypothetical protein
MSIMTTNEPTDSKMHLDRDKVCRHAVLGTNFEQPLTVSYIVKTMLEIIKIKKIHIMDKETREQFPMIAKEIILLAEQTQ